MLKKSIVEYFDNLPFELQKYITSFIKEDIDNNNIVHIFKFRKGLIFSTRLVNKLNYSYSYKNIVCIFFSPCMKKKLLNYIKHLIMLNDFFILKCFHFNFETLLIERNIIYIKEQKYLSYHNYAIAMSNKYNKRMYHTICFNKY